jgi:hypothetical protein
MYTFIFSLMARLHRLVVGCEEPRTSKYRPFGSLNDICIHGSWFFVINHDYATAGISFKVANMTRTINSQWFTLAKNSIEEREMKKEL